jgi:hypothetical protein
MRFNINTNIGTPILSCTIKEEKESYHLYYEIVYPYFVSKDEIAKHGMSVGLALAGIALWAGLAQLWTLPRENIWPQIPTVALAIGLAAKKLGLCVL